MSLTFLDRLPGRLISSDSLWLRLAGCMGRLQATLDSLGSR